MSNAKFTRVNEWVEGTPPRGAQGWYAVVWGENHTQTLISDGVYWDGENWDPPDKFKKNYTEVPESYLPGALGSQKEAKQLADDNNPDDQPGSFWNPELPPKEG